MVLVTLQTQPMLVQLIRGQVLAFGFYLHVLLLGKGHGPVGHSMIPHEVTMSSQLLLAVSSSKELLKAGSSIGIVINQNIFTANTIV